VGETAIDEQHQELLDHMNRLGRQVTQGDRTGIDEIMAFIGNYAHFHFDTEEAMMRETHYPLMAAHVREHRSFVERYRRLSADIAAQRSDPLYLGYQVQLFLFDWFANHSTKTDRHLGRFMAGLQTPEDSGQF
jgi:hemerythrin